MTRRKEQLAYPITCETEDIDGNWMLVTLLKLIGDKKWIAVNNENNETVVVSSPTLHNPKIWNIDCPCNPIE